MKFWKALLCFGLLLLPALLVNPHRLADVVFPVANQSLSWDPIKLEYLSPGETRLVNLEVRNDSWRTVQLTSIHSDCGCVVVKAAPQQLPARSSKIIEVSIHAPWIPGDFQHSLVFGASNFPEVIWQIDITGRVEADIWVEPMWLDVKLASGEITEALLAIRHIEGYPLGNFDSSDKGVQIIESWPIENGRMVKLAIHSSPTGQVEKSATFQVFSHLESETPCLEVPINRRPHTAIQFVPAKLDLGAVELRESASSILRRTVVATLRTVEEHRSPIVESLVPWVHVDLRLVAPSTYELALSLDVTLMSTTFSEPIIRMTLPNGEFEELAADVHRSTR